MLIVFRDELSILILYFTGIDFNIWRNTNNLPAQQVVLFLYSSQNKVQSRKQLFVEPWGHKMSSCSLDIMGALFLTVPTPWQCKLLVTESRVITHMIPFIQQGESSSVFLQNSIQPTEKASNAPRVISLSILSPCQLGGSAISLRQSYKLSLLQRNRQLCSC